MHFSEKPSDETQCEETASCAVRGFHVRHNRARCDRICCKSFGAECADLAIQELQQAGGRCASRYAEFRDAKFGKASFRCYTFQNSTLDNSGQTCGADKVRWTGVGEHGVRRVPQARNAPVWKDQASKYMFEADAIKAGYKPAK